MTQRTTTATIKIARAFSDGSVAECSDALLNETRRTLVVDGTVESVVVMTPGNEELWALGNLFCRRMIECVEDVSSVRLEGDSVLVERRVAREGWRAGNRFLHTSSSAFFADSARDNAGKIICPIEWRISFSSVMSGIEWLQSAPLFQATGCVHVAALIAPDGEKLFRTEDVGRHNAVDKAVGWMLKNNFSPRRVALMTSGRLPEDMVTKGAGAGISLMASVSAATLQGAELARECGMTLIGFARGKRMNVYSAPERLC